ncbi:polysaccharide deacetylase family protein [Candidatus Parcubacteria bacterium]|nr:polysaccharide deacetylase family protein [Candidatus Parcubacteria bacterium]
MIALKKAGYQTITLKEYRDFIDGKKELPQKSFLLTFDDGRKDSYYPVDPILKALDYKAVMFVITDTFTLKNSNYYLSVKELKKMIKSGRWKIQSHTKSGQAMIDVDVDGRKGKFFANKLWLKDEQRLETDEEFEKRINDDFVTAKETIEKEFGINVYGLAYPYGDYGQESLNYKDAENIVPKIAKLYYPVAFYQVNFNKNFIGNYTDQDIHFSKRISVKPNWKPNELLKILEVGEIKELPFEDTFGNYTGWKKNYGNFEYANNKMLLNSKEASTGNFVFLDGTKSWQDYAFEADLNWQKGSNIFLLARYNDELNNVMCNISDKYIKIESKIDGEKIILKEIKRNLDISKDSFKAGIKVNGNRVECSLDNKIIAYSDELSNILISGGIGFKTWDEEKGNSELIVKHVRVDEEWNNTNQVIVIDPSAPKKLPYEISYFNQDQGWKATWGTLEYDDKKLVLKSGEKSTGCLIFLEGSKEWKNYFFEAKIDWQKGNNVLLVAKYKDDLNYVTFNISDNYFRIEEFVNGEKTILEEIKDNIELLKNNLNIGFRVNGNRLEGIIDDNMVIFIDNSQQEDKNGGIGFKIWDPNYNNSELIVKKIRIEKNEKIN